jgi:hypothetical protein
LNKEIIVAGLGLYGVAKVLHYCWTTPNYQKRMKSSVYRLVHYLRRSLWALVVCYMLGLHNFYHGDNKTADDIIITTEVNEAQENGMPDD